MLFSLIYSVARCLLGLLVTVVRADVFAWGHETDVAPGLVEYLLWWPERYGRSSLRWAVISQPRPLSARSGSNAGGAWRP